jgi:hypothetical protein
MICDQKEEMAIQLVYINDRNKDVENKIEILYNDTVDRLKGM